jgi:hypothetical protein
MLTIAILALIASFSLLTSICGLWLAARWAGFAGVTRWRLAGVFVLLGVTPPLLALVFGVLDDAEVLPQWIVGLGQLAAGVVLDLIVISRVFRTTIPKAALAMLGPLAFRSSD